MAKSLCELHSTQTVAIYTLNYESLLMSALLEHTHWVYDGFRGLGFNDPLDPWQNIALYPLQGASASTPTRPARCTSGCSRKCETRNCWSAGPRVKDNAELPQVVLGDTKDSSTLLEPFASYCNQLAGDLAHPGTQEVIVGGHGFGDRPLNRTLGLFLAADENHRLRDWRPHATEHTDEVLQALRDPVSEAAGKRIKKEQITSDDIMLPSADAVKALMP